MVKLVHKYDSDENITCKEFVKKYASEYYKLFSWRTRPSYINEWEIETDGKAKDIFEQMVLMLYNRDDRLRFISYYESFPEDMIEGRTDFDEMKGYAIDMKHFIENVLELVSKIE